MNRQNFKKAIWATVIGNILEWYDFVIFSFFTLYISANFFGGEASDKIVKAFIIFSAAFVARPLGALVLGSYADRVGRKKALVLTIVLMGMGTALIAFSPSFHEVGYIAPAILLLARLLQGFSSGGEIGSAGAFLLEHAPKGRKSFYTSLFQSSMGIAAVLGSLMGFLLKIIFTQGQIEAWAWRIPFFFGLLIIPVALVIRRRIEESPEFVEALEKAPRKTPLKTIWREHKQSLFLGSVFGLLWTATPFVYVMFMPTFLMSPHFTFDPSMVFLASALGGVAMVVASPLGGHLVDRFGVTRTLVTSVVLMPIVLWLLMRVLVAHQSTAMLLVFYGTSLFVVSIFLGAAIGMISGSFPVEVRSSGVAIVYNVASLLTGFTPVILAILTKNNLFAPQLYLAFLAIPAAFAIKELGLRYLKPATVARKASESAANR